MSSLNAYYYYKIKNEHALLLLKTRGEIEIKKAFYLEYLVFIQLQLNFGILSKSEGKTFFSRPD